MDTRPTLDPRPVREFYDYCLSDSLDSDTYNVAPNILDAGTTCFDKKRIEESRAGITYMVRQFARRFRGANGAPFSDTKLDKHDDTWILDEKIQEKIVLLGHAAGLVEYIDSVRDSRGRPNIKVLL